MASAEKALLLLISFDKICDQVGGKLCRGRVFSSVAKLNSALRKMQVNRMNCLGAHGYILPCLQRTDAARGFGAGEHTLDAIKV